MFVDLNETESSPFSGVYDVCVCGSGPAGMTLARDLARGGSRVLLLEAGGLQPTPASQAVYQGESVGPLYYWGVESCRLRYFGGTSNHWSGRCGIFERLDFEQRDIWGMPGWPIEFDEAYARLDEAREILDIADQSLDPRPEPLWRKDRLPPAGYARSAPTRFGEKYRDELKASKRIDVVLNANVLDLAFGGREDSIESGIVADYRNRRFAVSAKVFVLAFGALETARFLLNTAATTGHPLGNQGDFVGRCFMEHLDIVLGRFVADNQRLWDREDSLSLNPSRALAVRRKLGTAVLSLSPAYRPKFFGRLAPLRRLQNDIKCRFTARDLERRSFCYGDGAVTTIIEQIPNTQSRVLIVPDSMDAFGQKRLAVNWALAKQDAHTIRGLAEEVGKALAEQDVGRLQLAQDVLDGDPRPGFHCHQMGTTRMSLDPRYGVVDENCRVHGTDNLYIAGSGVFPTGGGVNPTLTIVCLALRLGDHLSRLLARP